MFDIINGASEKFMEEMFLRIIKDFEKDDLSTAVTNNISLLDETMKYQSTMLAMAERTAKRFKGQSSLLTTENVLKWIKPRRYDFYFAVISDPDAHKWLDRQVKEFKEFLFNY